jgi:hypothetical protein
MELLAQAGGQTVVEYLTSKYHLMEVNTSPLKYHLMEAVVRLRLIPVRLWGWPEGLVREKWGRKERIELCWQRESSCPATPSCPPVCWRCRRAEVGARR